jgi:hypothetical protein
MILLTFPAHFLADWSGLLPESSNRVILHVPALTAFSTAEAELAGSSLLPHETATNITGIISASVTVFIST